jgi:hypothetical protein
MRDLAQSPRWLPLLRHCEDTMTSSSFTDQIPTGVRFPPPPISKDRATIEKSMGYDLRKTATCGDSFGVVSAKARLRHAPTLLYARPPRPPRLVLLRTPGLHPHDAQDRKAAPAAVTAQAEMLPVREAGQGHQQKLGGADLSLCRAALSYRGRMGPTCRDGT